MIPPIPENEEIRLAILAGLGILDTGPSAAFDNLCRRAAIAYAAPIALISLVDTDRQWFKARIGLSCDHTPRESSFCAHAILRDEPLIVLDATQDPRFSDNAMVVGEPFIRFYAGAPIYYGEQIRLGTLCIIDIEPRSAEQVNTEALQQLADEVAGELWVHQVSRQAAAELDSRETAL